LRKTVQDKLTLFFSLFAIVVSGIGLYRDCRQDKKIEENNYLSRAFTYQPLLKVTSQSIIPISPPEFSTTLDVLNDVRHIKEPEIDTIQKIISLNISSKLTIKNIGNYLARIVALVYLDTLYDGDYIRNIFLSNNFMEEKFRGKPFPEYFQKEILPSDSTTIEFLHSVNFIVEGRFTLHYLVFYENNEGALYDTYYWAAYKTKPLRFSKSIIGWEGSIGIVSYAFPIKDIFNSIEPIVQNHSNNIYHSLEDTKIVIGNLKKIK
jgi:hypothetical protein